MKRTILWLILLTAIVLYSLLVYSWLEEGTQNFERQKAEQQIEDLQRYKRN